MPDFRLPKSLEFTAEDFSESFEGAGIAERILIAARATALLTERLAKCETVYSDAGGVSPVLWYKTHEPKMDTHATKILPPWELGKDGAGDE